MLTILGFSIYDGIVVFDKVDENTKLVGTSSSSMTYSDMVNLSLNQVLMRSLNTSITALLPGRRRCSCSARSSSVPRRCEEFALALLIGLFAGAYSSIFIASPLLAVLKEREPRYRELKAKLAARQTPVTLPARPTDAGDGDGTDGDGEVAPTRRVAAGTAPALGPGHPSPAPQEGQEALGAVAGVSPPGLTLR